jgi:hypothetical protein
MRSSSFARISVAAAFAAGTFAVASQASAGITVEMFTGTPTNPQGGAATKFDALSATWGVTLPVTQVPSGAARANGRSQQQALVLTRRPDASTPALALGTSAGTPYGAAKITVSDGATTWQTVTLESVLITGFEQTAGQSRGDSTHVGSRLPSVAHVVPDDREWRGSRRFTPPKCGPRCARRPRVARLGTGRGMGGYVVRGLFTRSGFGLTTRSRGSRRDGRRPVGVLCARGRHPTVRSQL